MNSSNKGISNFIRSRCESISRPSRHSSHSSQSTYRSGRSFTDHRGTRTLDRNVVISGPLELAPDSSKSGIGKVDLSPFQTSPKSKQEAAPNYATLPHPQLLKNSYKSVSDSRLPQVSSQVVETTSHELPVKSFAETKNLQSSSDSGSLSSTETVTSQLISKPTIENLNYVTDEVEFPCPISVRAAKYNRFGVRTDRTPQVTSVIFRMLGRQNWDTIRPSQLSSIEMLPLAGLEITSLLPHDLSGFVNLKTLFLFENNLTTLPENIFSETPFLKSIYMGNNRIESLPVNIFKSIDSLECLRLYNNSLTSFPEEMLDDLSNVSDFSLFMNNIEELPENFLEKLPALKQFYIFENPFCDSSEFPSFREKLLSRGIQFLDI